MDQIVKKSQKRACGQDCRQFFLIFKYYKNDVMTL